MIFIWSAISKLNSNNRNDRWERVAEVVDGIENDCNWARKKANDYFKDSQNKIGDNANDACFDDFFVTRLGRHFVHDYFILQYF